MLLPIAVLLAFGASVTHGFHFDDYSVIHGAVLYTRPVTWLSFFLNSEISTHPALWHMVNLSAHLAAVLLLYKLLLKLITADAALLGALFFAVHPIQAEAVAYVYSRATLFSTAMSIVVCLLWLKGRLWAAVGCFAISLLSKEDCATVPIILLLLDRGKIRDKLAPYLSLVFLVFLSSVAALVVSRSYVGSSAGFSAGLSPGNYLLSQGYVILRYFRLTLLPYGFSIDPEIKIGALLAVACWLVVIAIAIYAAKRNRWILAGLILLVPSSSFIPLSDLAADHRMYLPMAAFAGCAGLWLARLPRAIAVICILLLIGVSADRMNVWASDERLWSEAVRRAPDKLRPHLQLARALEPGRALAELERAKKLAPANRDVDTEMGRVYLEMGRPQQALVAFGKVLGRTPTDPHALNNRGVALRAMGQEAAAQEDFRRALKVDSCFADARENLGLPPCH